MGTESARKSRYLYEISNSFDNFTFSLKQTEFYVTFESKVCKKGSYRYCYKGEIKNKDGEPTKPHLFPNEKCIVKVYQNKSYTTKDFGNDLFNYIFTRNISSAFNKKYYNIALNFSYATPYVTSLEKHSKNNLFYFLSFNNRNQMEKLKDDHGDLLSLSLKESSKNI